MLEGLEISEILFSKVINSSDDFRIHSEFFSKEFLRNEIKILSYESLPLFNYAKVSDGDHSKFPDNQKEEIRYLQARDINNYFLEITSSAFVSKEYFIKNKRSAIKSEDILLSIMGTVGDITITPQNFEVAMCNRALAIIKNVKGIVPQYLFAYLTSKFATLEIERLKNGGVQQRINLDVLSKVRIPSPSKEFQQKIKTVIILSQDIRQNSKSLYTEAENLLLQEIGLKDFEPSKEGINVKSLKESFLSSGRLDAEYYQPKYEEIEKAIKNYKYGYSELKDFIKNFSTGYPYKSDSYTENGGIPLIRINNVNKGSLDISNSIHIPLSDEFLSKKDIAVENDILISMSGTIGNSCKVPRGIKAVVNQRIMKITPKNFNSEVLPLVINSSIGAMQLNRIGTGGVQTNISSNDIKKILIPNLSKEVQTEIADLVEKSFSLKQKSEQLLESAKKAVEIAIEQDEETALQWIEIQLSHLEE